MNIHLNNRPILHDLGDGLILCRSTADDADCYMTAMRRACY
jgi:hypothetical protein